LRLCYNNLDTSFPNTTVLRHHTACFILATIFSRDCEPDPENFTAFYLFSTIRQETHSDKRPTSATMGRLAWIEDDAAGIRVPGWQNQLENMPEEATSSYATLNMYILDDVDPNAGDAQQGNAAQIKHAQFCNNMRDIFNNTLADFTVHSVRMQIGQQATHLLDYIEAEMENKTGDDLVVLCYQGKSGGDDDDYHL
jgi:protein-tyrosine phosphatase